jgi:hypothetical protein
VTCLDRGGLHYERENRHNRIVTITYPNGNAVEAVVLTHDSQEIRAVAPGSSDILTFRCFEGTWVSDEVEPVRIAFSWERRQAMHAPKEEDCLCPQNLAAQLVNLLQGGADEAPEIAWRAPMAMMTYARVSELRTN